MSGRPNRTADGRLGRFGRKAQAATLREFNAEALVMEMGVTNPGFLVEIEVNLPHGMTDEAKAILAEAELRRGRELLQDGVIQRIWRIPGGLRNVGIWSAGDATALHDALASLPMYPWLRAQVTALARHPLERQP